MKSGPNLKPHKKEFSGLDRPILLVETHLSQNPGSTWNKTCLFYKWNTIKKDKPNHPKKKRRKKSYNQDFQASISNLGVGSDIPIITGWVLKSPRFKSQSYMNPKWSGKHNFYQSHCFYSVSIEKFNHLTFHSRLEIADSFIYFLGSSR